MPPIRVMIVEDSGVIRQFLEHIISSDPRLTVVSSVGSAEEALCNLARVSPDVISMDIHLPGMSGFEATRRIMEDRPTPIVVVSGNVQSQELQSSMDTFKVGALAVVEKPVGTTHREYATMTERLCTQLAIMSQVKVIRQRFNGPRSRRRDVPDQRAAGPVPSDRLGVPQLIGIVASTGGPSALQTILASLPTEFPVPIAVVQHITASFHDGFVRWLDQSCRLAVMRAAHGQTAMPGHVYVAPPDCHLRVNGRQLALGCGTPVSAQCPSGTVLLDSMADSLKSQGMGIVLTGMGEDGAAGLLSIRRAGGHTIAEDESTAVVFGMPAVAARLGAACEQLPLERIAPRILHLAQVLEGVG